MRELIQINCEMCFE